MRLIILSVSILLFISCGSEGSAGLGVSPTSLPAPKSDSGLIANAYKVVSFEKFVERPILAKVWVDTSVYFHFSNEAEKDKFRIKIVGDEYYDAMIYFWITQKNKNLLFTDSFPLIDALSIALEGGGHYGTDSQKKDSLENM